MAYHGSSSTNSEQYAVLNRSIEEILSFIKPLESDLNLRINTIEELELSIRSNSNLLGITVCPFGSFVSNLYSKWGDLDISINLSAPQAGRSKKLNALRDLRRALQRRGIGRNIQFIPAARVPLLVYESSLYGISCDVSVNNYQGYVKSKVMQLMTGLDERFTDMVLLIKEWAKAQKINDPKAGTLNSYSLCLLVIFHLQTCEPAILPPVKEIFNGNISDDVDAMAFSSEKQIEEACLLNIHNIMSNISTRKNESSLCQLLISFFDKFSEIEAYSSDYVICTSTGRWEMLKNNPKWNLKTHNLLIEDPFEQPDNAARSVCTNGLKTISDAFKTACQSLSPPSRSLSNRNSLLRLLSRPLVSSKLGATKKLSNPNIYNNNNNSSNFYQQANHFANRNYVDNQARYYNSNSSTGTSNANFYMNRNNVDNRARYYNNQSYNARMNMNGGIMYANGMDEMVSEGSNNRSRLNGSNYNQSYNAGVSRITPTIGLAELDRSNGSNYNQSYNGGMNGITPTIGLAELDRSNGSNSNSNQSNQIWKPRGRRSDYL